MSQTSGERSKAERKRWAAIETLALADPNAVITALAPLSDEVVELPDRAQQAFRGRTMKTKALSAVSAGDRARAVAAWGKARSCGWAHCVVEIDEAERTGTHTMYFFDLRESEGAMIVVVTNVAAPESEETVGESVEIRPRRTELTYDEAGTVLTSAAETAPMFAIADDAMVGRSSLDFVHPDDHELAINQWLELVAEPGAKRRMRLQYRRGDDTFFWLEATLENRLDVNGTIHGELLDINEEMDALSELRRRERVLARLAEALPSGVAQIEGDEVAFSNERWATITGTAPRAVEDLKIGLNEDDEQHLQQALHAVAQQQTDIDIDVTYERSDGPRRCRLSLRTLADQSATAAEQRAMIVSLVDVTESWALNQRLAEQAERDHLTGIPNRLALMSTLAAALEVGAKSETNTAVMFFDLNGFKGVNDRLGHAAGDELLQHVAQVIAGELRSQDTVGRVGGDEFIVICPAVPDVEVAEHIAERIQQAVRRPVVIGDEPLQVGVSCGITVTATREETPDELIAEADLAMYASKNRDADGPVTFDSQLVDRQTIERNRAEALRLAPTDSSLELHYQPMFDLGSGDVLGYESLVRWWLDGSLEPPLSFIPLAERRGIIGDIGGWVLDEVCRLGATLLADGAPQRVSINASSLQLRDTDFPHAVAAALDASGLPADRLMVEMAESVISDQGDDLPDVLRRLADLGVAILIDDFGTGHGSLNMLRRLPVTGVKINAGFVAELANPRTSAIVQTILDLGRALDLTVIAKGIETEEQADRLRRLGARYGQGFLFAVPAPFDEIRPASSLFPLGRV